MDIILKVSFFICKTKTLKYYIVYSKEGKKKIPWESGTKEWCQTLVQEIAGQETDI